MTNEEKIRLVLETLGTDNVRNATKALRDLDNAIDKTASTMEGSKRKFDPQSLLILGQAVDDIQYGLRGILNNIPQLVQSFGGGAAAAGGFQIAMIAINFALTKLGSLIEDTTPKVKPFSEQLDKLADSGKQSTAQVDALADSAKKLAENFGPSLIESFDNTVKRMGEIVATMREAQALQKEMAQENAAREKGQAKIDEKGKAKDAAGLFGEFFGGMSEDDALALRDRVARDSKQRAEGELIDSEMSALEGAGTWSGLKYRTLTGAQSLAQKRLEAESKAAAREAIRKRINQDGSIDKQSQSIAAGLIEDALGGDPRAIQRMRDAGGFGEFEAGNASDIAFQGSLADRSKAVAARNARRKAKEEEELKKYDEENERFDASNDRWRQGGGARRRMAEMSELERFDEENRKFEEGNERWRQGGGKKRREEDAAEKARRDILTGLADQLPDPETLAAMRRGNAGTDRFAVQRMRALESQDQNALFGTFRNAGMNEGDAKRSVAEYMQQGNEAFSEFAQANGMNARNLSSGFKASQVLLQKIMQDQAEVQEVIQWMQAAANMQNQPQAKPPNRVRN